MIINMMLRNVRCLLVCLRLRHYAYHSVYEYAYSYAYSYASDYDYYCCTLITLISICLVLC